MFLSIGRIIDEESARSSPQLEVIVFQLEDSIAVSGESVSGLICGEEIK